MLDSRRTEQSQRGEMILNGADTYQPYCSLAQASWCCAYAPGQESEGNSHSAKISTGINCIRHHCLCNSSALGIKT